MNEASREPRQRRIVRTAVRLLACLAGGAVLTVLVAWSLSLWATVTLARSFAVRGPQNEPFPAGQLGWLGTLIDPEWAPRPSRGWATVVAHIGAWRGWGLSDDDVTVMSYDGGHGSGNQVVYSHRAGWPARALRCVNVLRDRRWRWEDSWTPPQWLARSGYSEDPRLPRPPLPLRPEPVGFATNTLMYAGLLGALWLGPRSCRRSLRRHRGLCTQCGYSLAGVAAPLCPECGTAHTAR